MEISISVDYVAIGKAFIAGRQQDSSSGRSWILATSCWKGGEELKPPEADERLAYVIGSNFRSLYPTEDPKQFVLRVMTGEFGERALLTEGNCYLDYAYYFYPLDTTADFKRLERSQFAQYPPCKNVSLAEPCVP